MVELMRTHHTEQLELEADEAERRRRGVTFRELASEWMVYLEREKGVKPSSLRDYRWVLAEPGQPHRRGTGRSPGLMMARFGNRRIREITTRDLAEYLRSLDRMGTRPRSVNKHRQVLSSMFSYAMREDAYQLPKNPVTATSKRREPPPVVLDFYEPEEIEAIARAAERGDHREVTKLSYDDEEQHARDRENRQDAALIRVAAYTGLRLGELLALRWGDVNLVDRRLVVHRAFSDRTEGPTKSWQARFLPIADPVAAAFARLADRGEFVSSDDYVFCSRLGRPLDGSALRRRWKRAAEAAGLRVLRFHALRHGAGSMVARQADPRWVQGFLGHSKLTTTERYLHAKARPEDVQLLNRAFAVAGPPARRVVKVSADTLREWDRQANENPLPNDDPNRTVLRDAGGRPATREEILELAEKTGALVTSDNADRG